MKKNSNDKNTKAQKRVQQLKGFYTHLMIYLMINTMLMLVKIVGTAYYGETFMGPLWHFSTFSTWLFWGLGLAFHAIKVFALPSYFNGQWEERRIRRFMEEDRQEAEKYNQERNKNG